MTGAIRAGAVIGWVALSLTTTSARASELGPPLAPEDAWRIDAEIGLAGDSDDHSQTLGVSPAVSASYRLTPLWFLSAEWGVAWVHTSPDRGESMSRFALSNLVVGGGLERGSLDNGWFAARAVVAAPTARLPGGGPSRGLARSAYDFALAARGLYRPWVWAPNQIGGAVEAATATSGDLAARSRARYLLDANAGVGVTVPVADASASTQLFSEAAGEAAIGAQGFLVGPRLQAVWMPLSTTARLQFALGGVVTIGLGEHAQLRAQLLRAVDAPLANGLGAWGFVLGGSGSW